MHKSVSFPTTIVDGFFDNPDLIREFALKQEYNSDPDRQWPGKRCNLLDVSPLLCHNIVQRSLMLFFDSEFEYSVPYSYFQIVDKKYGRGWVHRDVFNNSILTGIIYMTPGSNSGTSLYKKTRPLEYDDISLNDKKKNYYDRVNNNICIPSNEIDYSKIHNSEYEETLSITGVYNRLVLFDSCLYHSAHDFYGDTLNDSRLTILFFINRINCNYSALPIPRMSLKLGDNPI